MATEFNDSIPESSRVIFDRISTDIKNELNELDPYLRNSLLRAINVADANAFFELYKTLLQLKTLTFWNTTEGSSLETWAAIWGITRNPSTKANGFVVFTGISGSIIASGSQFSASSGELYEITQAKTITNNTISVSSINRVSQLATVITAGDHNLSSNIDVIISGANQAEYNGTFTITVTGSNSFTYQVEGSPTTPATGTIFVASTSVIVTTQSLDFGQDQNLLSGSEISLGSPIAGVDSNGYVAFDEIAGGTDLESDDSLRERFLFRIQKPIALFNENAIINEAKKVSGVTRVWVQNVDSVNDSVVANTLTRSGDFAIFETASPHGLFDCQPITVLGANENEYNITNQPILVISTTKFGYVVSGTPATPATGNPVASFSVAALGQVRVFFVRDNDDDIIPTGIEISDINNQLLTIKPATMSGNDLQVGAPTPNAINFTFTVIIPDTTAMRSAIENNLESFFATGSNLAEDVRSIDYDSILNATVDSAGNKLQFFVLSTPTSDISIGSSELGVLGTITFS